MIRHDENQQAAERIAKKVGGFQFEWRTGATLTVTKDMALCVLRRALDRGLIAEVPQDGATASSTTERPA